MCTPSEAVFVQYDIQHGQASASGTTESSCYQCLLGAGCLDSPSERQEGLECGDLPAGSLGSAAESASLCVSALQCIVQTGCDDDTPEGEAYCYCGTEGGSTESDCEGKSSPFPLNGVCATQETAGFTYTSNSALVTNFLDTMQPSGMANEIFDCSIGNGCSTGAAGTFCP